MLLVILFSRLLWECYIFSAHSSCDLHFCDVNYKKYIPFMQLLKNPGLETCSLLGTKITMPLAGVTLLQLRFAMQLLVHAKRMYPVNV